MVIKDNHLGAQMGVHTRRGNRTFNRGRQMIGIVEAGNDDRDIGLRDIRAKPFHRDSPIRQCAGAMVLRQALALLGYSRARQQGVISCKDQIGDAHGG